MTISGPATKVSPMARRVLARTFSSVALTTTLAQILAHLQVLSAGQGNRCDYPDECVTDWFPALWVTIRILWLFTLVMSVAAIATRFTIADITWSKFWAALAMLSGGMSLAVFPMRNEFNPSAPFRETDAILAFSALEWLGIVLLVGGACAHLLALFMKSTGDVERNWTDTHRV